MGMTRPSRVPAWPFAMLVLALVLQATLVVHRAINWDEFYHYSQVYALTQGTLTQPLQTLYTRAFAWVVALPGSGIDHILIIRWFMLGCEIATLAAIIGIASRFASREAAWLCALAYAGAGFVFQHATSFRFDGPCAALLMCAAWIMLRARLRLPAIAAIGLLVGTAGVLTVKAALYAPVFAGIAWLRWTEAGRDLRGALRLALVGLSTMLSFAAIYLLHSRGLASNPDGEAQAMLGRAGGQMFTLGVQPYWPHHVKGALMAPLVTLAILAFPFVLRASQRPLAEKLALTGLLLPLTTLLFYHNTAPYYFVYMLAPVCAGLGPVAELAAARYGSAKLAIAMGGLALAVWVMEKPGPLERQRELIAAADAILPDRPAYFDSCAMLGSFPKANPFMTPVGTALYLNGSYPSMVSVMAKRPVPLVLANDPVFAAAMTTRDPVGAFLPQDLAALREGYLHWWGPFWIAGRQFTDSAAFDLLVPGQYRVEGAALQLDGKVIQPGSVIELARGAHRAELQPGQSARIVWAAAKAPPAAPPPPEPWFTDF